MAEGAGRPSNFAFNQSDAVGVPLATRAQQIRARLSWKAPQTKPIEGENKRLLLFPQSYGKADYFPFLSPQPPTRTRGENFLKVSFSQVLVQHKINYSTCFTSKSHSVYFHSCHILCSLLHTYILCINRSIQVV